MNKSDTEMAVLAKATLAKMPSRRSAEKGLDADQKAITVITFADGSKADAWGHSRPLQVASIMRKKGKRDQAATVEHVIRDENGRGAVIRVDGTFAYTEGKSGGEWNK